jgi:NADH-quinone oxidoreductase subunit K
MQNAKFKMQQSLNHRLRGTRRLHFAFCILNYKRRATMGLQAYLILAATVFCIGLFGVVTRRNTIGILLGIELMLNAVNINLVAFSHFNATATGMIFTLFTICITVSEAAIGLALVILLFRVRRTVMADHLDILKG